MDTGNVSRGKLLEVLRKNRDRHVENYQIATEERELEIAATLKAELTKSRKDSNYKFPDKLLFPKCENYAAEYDRAIRMLEMSVDQIVELDNQQFDQLVMDNWSWQREFLRTANTYAAGKLK